LISSFPFAIIFFNDQVLAAIVCCCLLATCCSGEEVEAIATKAADKVEAIATTKLTPSIEDDPKSKTEKRDSSVQTGEPE